MEATDLRTAINLASRAVQLDDHCLDALTLLAQVHSANEAELLEAMRGIVAVGAESLGERYIEENRGHFWGILETRPYMRAHAYLAQLLLEANKIDEAVVEYETLLHLNPGDNQGLRYPLLGCYLQTGNLATVCRLFDQFEDEGSATFAWARVLERLLSQDGAGAKTALTEARETNPHIEAYLTGQKRVPNDPPDYYGFGDENEAIVCADAIGAAWRANPAAVAWLQRAG